MLSGVLFISQKGEVILSRWYRSNVSKASVDAFRHEVIQAKNFGAPVVLLDGCSFIYTRVRDVFVVTVSKNNANAALAFQFLFRLVEVCTEYFHGKFDDETVRGHYVLLYELLDEMLDNGYPQITATQALSVTIQSGSLKKPKGSKDGKDEEFSATDPNTITAAVTGSVDWRQPNTYRYRKNEVFIDVLESVNLLMSTRGQVLRADVAGKVMMKTFLTGMPEAKFGMNDKLVLEHEAKQNVRRRRGGGIAIDDLSFHRCVRLNQFEADRTISFIPPDGEFELMKYRITHNVNLPFKILPVISEHGRTRVEYEIKIKGNFSPKLFATDVILFIPTPPNTAKAKISVTSGKAKFVPDKHALRWKISRFGGDASITLKAEVKLVATMSDKTWSRPPINATFSLPMFTASGLHVRFLKIYEKTNYPVVKWVRYISRAGSYQIRI